MFEKSISRVDALREQVHAQGDQVDVAGALALAEQTALDAVSHQGQLGGGDGRTPVVVRVHGQADELAAGQVCATSTRSGPRAWTASNAPPRAGLRMISRPGPGRPADVHDGPATPRAKSSSVSVKISGLYW